jgi:hypothetical protein
VATKAAGSHGLKAIPGQVVITGDYETAGLTPDVVLSDLFEELKCVLFDVGAIADLSDGLIAKYDEANDKITLYDTTGASAGIIDEVANTTTIVATTFNFVAFGF